MSKNSNFLNPTPAQIKYRNRLWAEELIKNRRKAIGLMTDEHGGRCCLKVAEDLFFKIAKEKKYDLTMVSYNSSPTMPGNYVSSFFGWDSSNRKIFKDPSIFKNRDAHSIHLKQYSASQPILLIDGRNSRYKKRKYALASKLNDSCKMSHKKIAECVLNTLVHPSKPKWVLNKKR